MAVVEVKEIIIQLNNLGEDINARNEYLESVGIMPKDIIDAIRMNPSQTEMQIYTYILSKKINKIKKK